MIVRVRGVKQTRSPSGKVYYYHRATRTRIKARPGTAAFAAEVERLNKGRALAQSGAGTLGALIAAYKASPEYHRLADRTRADYQHVCDYLADMDAALVTQIDGPAMLAIRDKAFSQRKRRFANHVTQVLGTVLNWGKRRRLSFGNPLAGERDVKIPRPKELPRANRPWSQDEAAAIFEHAYPGLRLALGLAYYAGMRGGDIVRVTWSIYDGERLEWKQGKTGDVVSLPALSELRALLDAAPRAAPTIATNTFDRPMTEAGLRKAFRLLILRLLRDRLVAPGLTLHACRHTLGDELANLGAEPRMIQAVLGHRSMSASLHYSQGADRKRAAAAAVHLLETRRKAKD
jgi:integrase